MKFNIEVELDWIDEEEGLDEAVQTKIINAVIKEAKSLVETKVDQAISGNIDSIVQDTCKKLVDEFTSGKFIKADKWGDVIEETTVKEYVKQSFDSYWSQQVTAKGDTDTYYAKRGEMKPRIKWLIDNRIAEHAQEFARTLVDDTDAKIKNSMKESLQQSIGAKLVSELGFDKLLVTDGKKK